ncbi:hypothetical protein DPMN_170327 [Dreissena polymorpha]|uniref:Mab-21-like HhH/H2TH-like domain-containing protein n=1 Tax=Dreissena polymorpha TaxID=45954 RepID=A0A9D4DZ18_DREPO|nr:hypothetical protein DPMN_170327 [Dreissena polymorpha]
MDRTAISLALSVVMDDIGVSEEMIKLRRHMCLFQESFNSWKEATYIFGSQSEGSTTLGMESDFDTLRCNGTRHVGLDVSKMRIEDMNHLLVRTPFSLPQCCSLQVVIPITETDQVPWFGRIPRLEPTYITDEDERLVLSSWAEHPNNTTYFCSAIDRNVEYHGPALTVFENRDIVLAERCKQLPDDCKIIFSRSRPGHWPRSATLEEAKHCEMFLNKPGFKSNDFGFNEKRHYGFILVQSSYPISFLATQWRMSTNLIERLLMFDLNAVQMKAYVITKMIKKEHLKLAVGDRLSTFQFKTALMFTVEQTPPEIWTEDNLVQCVVKCLTTMKRFLKRRYCPHYTIAAINLFADKLMLHEFQLLQNIISDVLETCLNDIFPLKMDDIGERMAAALSLNLHTKIIQLTQRNENERAIVKSILTHLVLCSPVRLIKDEIRRKHNTCSDKLMEKGLVSAIKCFKFCLQDSIKTSVDGLWLQTLQSTLTSLKASVAIGKQKKVSQKIINLYEISLYTGTLACYLKYASMFICTEQYRRSASVLADIEEQIKPLLEVLPLPGSTEQHDTRSSKDITKYAKQYMEKVSMPVVFMFNENNCVPDFLEYEIHAATIPANSEFTRDYVSTMKNDVAADALPYFFYLKFITFKQLGQPVLQKAAFDNILKFRRTKELFGTTRRPLARYGSTTMNLIGHCWEMNYNYLEAVKDYMYAQEMNPHNNAASWHIFVLVGRCLANTA